MINYYFINNFKSVYEKQSSRIISSYLYISKNITIITSGQCMDGKELFKDKIDQKSTESDQPENLMTLTFDYDIGFNNYDEVIDLISQCSPLLFKTLTY